MCLYSLADWLKQRDTEYRISSWFKQIVSAVAYIHEKGFMHRDLKVGIFLLEVKKVHVLAKQHPLLQP